MNGSKLSLGPGRSSATRTGPREGGDPGQGLLGGGGDWDFALCLSLSPEPPGLAKPEPWASRAAGGAGSSSESRPTSPLRAVAEVVRGGGAPALACKRLSGSWRDWGGHSSETSEPPTKTGQGGAQTWGPPPARPGLLAYGPSSALMTKVPCRWAEMARMASRCHPSVISLITYLA